MFITCRRTYIDKFLFNTIPFMKGKVLDIGGKKIGKRGDFIPPEIVELWDYVNTEESTKPDYCCDALNIPMAKEYYDTVLMCELLEHVENPFDVLKEATRVLKPGGILIITIPFLIAYHPDPKDFQRYSHEKLNLILKNLDFDQINIIQQGSILSVILDLFYTVLCRSKKRGSILNNLGFYFQRKFGPYAIKLDKRLSEYSQYINTGYGITAVKKNSK